MREKKVETIFASDRKEAEEFSRESEEKIRSIFRAAPAGIGVVINRVFTEVNERFCEMTGYTRDEVIGQLARMIYASDADYEFVGREKYGQIAQRGTGAVETRFLRKDGTVINVLLSSTPIDAANLSRGVIFTALDITEHKRTEEALQQRAAELVALNVLGRAVNATRSLDETMTAALHGMLNAIHSDLAFFFLREGDKLILKQVLPTSARHRLDMMPDHRVGKCLCGLAVQEKKPLYSRNIFNDRRCSWEECKKAGVKSFASLPLSNGDEVIGVIGLASVTERDYERQAEFLETLADQVSTALANARLFEITQLELAERNRAEKALRRSEEHFRALIEHSSDMIFIVDKNGTNTYVSSSVESILGYKPEELNGKSCFHIILPVDVPRAIHDFSQAILTKETVVPNVFRVRHKDGSERTLEGVGISLFHNPTIAGFLMNVRDITERKKAEADLLRMHTLLNETQAIAKLGGWEYDVAAKRVTWTDEVYRIYGVGPDYDPSDIGKNMNFYTPESVPILQDAFQRAVELGEPYDLELEFLRANGERIWIRTLAKPVLESGKVVRLTGNFMDITERKRVEEALRESEEKHRVLLEQSPDPIFSFTPEGRYKYVNHAFAEGVGKSVEDIIGRTIWDVFPKEEADKRFAFVSQIFSTGKKNVIEVRVPRADGDRYYVTTITPIKDPEGRVFSAICSSKEITDRKRMEVALRESEARFRNIFEHAAEGIFQSTPDGHYVTVNPSFARMLGFDSPEQMIGAATNISSLYVHPEVSQEIVHLLKTVGEVKHFQAELSRRDGKHIWISINAKAVRDEKQNLFFEGMVEDITERKRAEEALQQQMDELRRWHQVTLGRETRVLDLKREVNELLAKIGQPPRYESAVTNGGGMSSHQ